MLPTVSHLYSNDLTLAFEVPNQQYRFPSVFAGIYLGFSLFMCNVQRGSSMLRNYFLIFFFRFWMKREKSKGRKTNCCWEKVSDLNIQLWNFRQCVEWLFGCKSTYRWGDLNKVFFFVAVGWAMIQHFFSFNPSKLCETMLSMDSIEPKGNSL